MKPKLATVLTPDIVCANGALLGESATAEMKAEMAAQGISELTLQDKNDHEDSKDGADSGSGPMELTPATTTNGGSMSASIPSARRFTPPASGRLHGEGGS